MADVFQFDSSGSDTALAKAPSGTHERTKQDREAVGEPSHGCFRTHSHSDRVYRTQESGSFLALQDNDRRESGIIFFYVADSTAECSYAYQKALSLGPAMTPIPRLPSGAAGSLPPAAAMRFCARCTGAWRRSERRPVRLLPGFASQGRIS